MAQARDGAASRTPAVEMDAVSRNCRRVGRNKRPSFRKAAASRLLFWLGAGALIFRTIQLFFLKDVQTGLVWATKIVTDPFNDAKIYCKAPLALMRGELIDPGLDIIEHNALVEEHA